MNEMNILSMVAVTAMSFLVTLVGKDLIISRMELKKERAITKREWLKARITK